MALIFSKKTGFEETADFTSLPPREKGEEGDAWKMRVGYEQLFLDGDPDGKFIEGYEYIGDDKTIPPYIVEILDYQVGYTVFVWDLASLFQLRFQSAAFLSASEVSARLDDMQTLLQRLFQAVHGHSYRNPCAKCDPVEHKKMQERKSQPRMAQSSK